MNQGSGGADPPRIPAGEPGAAGTMSQHSSTHTPRSVTLLLCLGRQGHLLNIPEELTFRSLFSLGIETGVVGISAPCKALRLSLHREGSQLPSDTAFAPSPSQSRGTEMSLPILLLDFLPPQILDTLTSTKIYTKNLYNPELRKARDQIEFLQSNTTSH